MIRYPFKCLQQEETYSYFCLPYSLHSRLTQAVYTAANMTTLDGNQTAIVEMEKFSWHYSAKTYLSLQ